MWLAQREQWDKLAIALRRAGEFGADTETYNQPDKTSPQHRTKIHCWSVGILSDARTPRGYRRAVGRVLPRDALEYGPLRDVLGDPGLPKFCHNAPHDWHSFVNEGVPIGGMQDTLQWARVALPGMRDYGLKEMERWALGYGPRPSFMEMVSYEATVVHARGRTERGCICGGSPCRARSTSWFLAADGEYRPHVRVSWKVFSPISRVVPARYDVTDFVPGAQLAPLVWKPTKDRPTPPGWWKGKPLDRLEEWWAYSAADAIRGMELVDWLRNQKPKDLVYPWNQPKLVAA